MTARIVAVDGGTFYHREALSGPRYAALIHRVLYAPDLPSDALDDADVLLIADRVNPRLLVAAADRIRGFLAGGGTLVAMGETRQDLWLDGVGWEYRPTNFWWWLKPGESLGLKAAAPAHPFFRQHSVADATWHIHGVLHPPAGAVSLLEIEGDRGSILYDDCVSSPGRIIATTLDPFYHHGSNFMPATTRFLDRFMPWLAAGPERP